VAGLAAAFGSGAMTNTIADIEQADVILITGSNTSENHPVISSVVKRAVKFRGAKLIVADPRRIKMTEFAQVWLRQNLGTDVAWINGMMHVILKENLHDQTFIQNRTEDFEQFKQALEKYTPEFVEGVTGIPSETLVEAARLFAGAKAGSILYCMGITQHISGTDNVKALANLSMLTGNLGFPGAGLNPLRGQNNVQGACDMGGLPVVYTAYQPVNDPAVIQKMEQAWGVTGLSTQPGLKATEMIPMAYKGELKAMYIIGENPMLSDADLHHVEASLKNLDFLVVQDIFMTETAQAADVVLPSSCFAEKEGTFANTERRVQRVRKAVEAPGQCKDDWWITSQIASRMGYPMNYENSRAIFEEIRRVTPSYGGISYERIEVEGLHWPCPTPDHPGTPILHGQQFTRGKGKFHAIEWIPPAEQVDDQYPLYLTTGRLLYHYHTGTMTMKSDDLNERAPRSYVEMAFGDAQKYGLQQGDKVIVSSRRGKIEVEVRIEDKAVEGTVFIPFHYAQGAANILTSAAALDPTSGIPELKVCAVQIAKAA
jgi:formate dehydrogenase major subunit